ncbi:hypothetical protein [Photobacterium leiognathi]|uniref:hypothetical protein n=1 Tax=Photobacterium leiognathi TaxID=553611 RepID=UPI002980BAD1|nr:hypothetical protein [Photobacterium leiognathi]
MDLVQWKYKGDKFSCSLNQSIHHFGSINFVAKPKQPLGVQVNSFHVKTPYERAILSQVTSPWESDYPPVVIEEIGLAKKTGKVSFYDDIDNLLEAMAQGQWRILISVERNYLLLHTEMQGMWCCNLTWVNGSLAHRKNKPW